MNKIGTHNSLSYLPCQWYLRPFSWIGKCQSKTIEEQYNDGVRYFDIRVKFNKNKKPISGHGILTYNIDIEEVLKLLNDKKDDTIIVRLFLENNKKKPRELDELFSKYIEKWMLEYKYLYFVEGGCRYEYKAFINRNIKYEVCYAEYWKKKFCIPFPRLWAKMHNKKNHLTDNDKIFNVYDFYNE